MVTPSVPRDATLKTPPGPEGSNGINGCGRRDQPAGLPPLSALRLLIAFIPSLAISRTQALETRIHRHR